MVGDAMVLQQNVSWKSYTKEGIYIITCYGGITSLKSIDLLCAVVLFTVNISKL